MKRRGILLVSLIIYIIILFILIYEVISSLVDYMVNVVGSYVSSSLKKLFKRGLMLILMLTALLLILYAVLYFYMLYNANLYWCIQLYTPMKIIGVKVPEELKKRFKEKVRRNNTNMSVVLRELIEKYVNE